MRRTVSALAVLGLLLTGPARAERDREDVRRSLEILVRAAVHGPELSGPSPTRIVEELVTAPPEVVVPVLREVWDSRADLSWNAARVVEETVQFLYGLDRTGDPLEPGRPAEGGPWVCGGALLVRCEENPERFAGPFAGRELPPFDERFRGRTLRAAPRPDAARLLAAIESGEAVGWIESERVSLAKALGEAAADVPEVRARILALLEESPGDRLLGVAAAWAEAPEAVPALRRRFLTVARAGRNDTEFELWELGRCLSRAKPGSIRSIVAALDGKARETALAAVGLELLAPAILRDLATAKEAEGRRAALDEFARLVGGASGAGRLPASEMPALLESFVTLLDQLDGEDREKLLAVAEEIFYAYNRYPIQSSMSDNDTRFAETGASIGPYPDMETVLRAMAEETAAGRLVFLDGEEPPLSPVPNRLGGESPRAHSDVRCPEPNRPEPEHGFPVYLSAEWAENGLRIRLRNVGDRTFYLNPVALRVATGHVTDVVAERAGSREEYRQLRLELGFIRTEWATPAAALVDVPPGGTYEWVQPVREEDRNAGHVVLSWNSLTILGRTPGPVLTELGDTWVR